MATINRTNWIWNNPVTEDDIKRAYGIFGKDIVYLKGHTKRKKHYVILTI